MIRKKRYTTIIFGKIATAVLALAMVELALAIVPSARAVGNVEVTSEANYIFARQVTFRATVQSDEALVEAVLFIKPEGQDEAKAGGPVEVNGGQLLAIYDLTQRPLRAFSTVEYRYQMIFQDGDTLTSEWFQFNYFDNRFNWQNLEMEAFSAHWYKGDVTFAQELLNVAQAGLKRARDFLPVEMGEKVDIYVYDNSQDVQAALQLSGQNWVAGHADPDLRVILVSLPEGPEQHLEMERQIPHELMHVLVYQLTGDDYKNLPTWLVEGLASVNELYPNPDYQVLLENAYRSDGLLPLSSLCQVFPRDASSVLLAYAEAASFTSYLYQQYGRQRLNELVQGYASGLGCERGTEHALGETLSRLEMRWRREAFAENTYLSTLGGLLPWLVLLLAALAAPFAQAFLSARRRGGVDYDLAKGAEKDGF